MSSIDLETAVAQFLDWARKCQQQRLTSAGVLREFVEHYRNVRIADADLADGRDILLFEWGVTTPFLLNAPVDFRRVSDDEITPRDDKEVQFVSLTRQIFASSNDDDDQSDEEVEDDEYDADDFDSSAIQMVSTLLYGPAKGDEKRGSFTVSAIKDIDRGLKRLSLQPIVASLIDAEPTRYEAFVTPCG